MSVGPHSTSKRTNDNVKDVVIGAGVVGLAVARELPFGTCPYWS